MYTTMNLSVNTKIASINDYEWYIYYIIVYINGQNIWLMVIICKF